MKGVLLCSRYSYEPCHLGYCGPHTADAVLKSAISGGTPNKAKEELMKFEGLYPYLWLIGDRAGLDPFDDKVVEAYWLGNSLLDKVSTDDIKQLINEQFSKFLTKSVAARLASNVPNGAVAHHSFHVFHILNVQSLTGRVPANYETLNNCFVNPCTVDGVGEEKLSVSGCRLMKGGKFGELESFAVMRAPWLKKVSVGDHVGVHWGLACDILEKRTSSELFKLTEKQAKLLL